MVAGSPPELPEPHVPEAEPRCLVVMYHYVHDRDPLAPPGPSGAVSQLRALRIAEFRRQLDLLTSTMEPIDWPMLYGWLSGRKQIPHRSFVLTFDDGLADHASHVLPILEERGLRGTFFVPSSVLISHRMLPAHQIHLLLSALGEAGLVEGVRHRLRDRYAGEWCRHLDHEDDADAAAMYHYEPASLGRLKFLLTMKLPLDLRRNVLDQLFEEHIGSSIRWARHWYLTWDDVVKMEALGHTIGGHGHLHEPYARMSDAEVRADIARAASVLREGLGPDLRPFSFPYGSVTAAACQTCPRVGFINAFTTESRFVLRQDPACRLPRCDTIHVTSFLEEKAACPHR